MLTRITLLIAAAAFISSKANAHTYGSEISDTNRPQSVAFLHAAAQESWMQRPSLNQYARYTLAPKKDKSSETVLIVLGGALLGFAAFSLTKSVLVANQPEPKISSMGWMAFSVYAAVPGAISLAIGLSLF